MRKTRGEESLTCVYSCRPLHHWKRSQNWMELIFITYGASFFLGNQFPSTWLWYFSPERDGYHPENGSCQYGQYVHSLPSLSFAQVHESDLNVETPWILLDLNPNLSSLNVKLTITPGFPTDNANCKDHIWVPSPTDKWTQAQQAQHNKFVKDGLENWVLMNQTSTIVDLDDKKM